MADELGSMRRKPFNCMTCGRCFYTQSCLQKHQCIPVKDQSQREYCKCDFCDKSFYDADHLRLHACIDFGDPRYYLNKEKALHPCKFIMVGNCHTVDKYDKKCPCSALLDSHSENSIIENTSFKCKMCHNVYVTQRELYNHNCLARKVAIPPLNDQHTPATWSFKCQFCSENFKTNQLLIDHVCSKQSSSVKNPSSGDHGGAVSFAFKGMAQTTNEKFDKKFNFEKTPMTAQIRDVVLNEEENQKDQDEEEQMISNDSFDNQERKFVNLKREQASDNHRGDPDNQSSESHSSRSNDQYEDFYINACNNQMDQTERSFDMRGIDYSNFPNFMSHGNYSTRCKTCNKIFSHKGNLKIHMRIHANERPFPCQFCNKSFTMKQNMEIHMRTHTGEKPFRCDRCDYRSITKQQMQKHILKHDDTFVIPKIENCTKCGKFCNHDDIHNGLCRFCLTSDGNMSGDNIQCMNENTGISEMIRKNSADGVFEENLPGDSGERSVNMDKTEDSVRAVNLGNIGPPQFELRLFNCDICGKVFGNRASLHSHMISHVDLKWFKCNFCDKEFRLKQTRDIHERIHTGFKPFQCNQCGKTFITKQHMQKHTCRLSYDAVSPVVGPVEHIQE